MPKQIIVVAISCLNMFSLIFLLYLSKNNKDDKVYPGGNQKFIKKKRKSKIHSAKRNRGNQKLNSYWTNQKKLVFETKKKYVFFILEAQLNSSSWMEIVRELTPSLTDAFPWTWAKSSTNSLFWPKVYRWRFYKFNNSNKFNKLYSIYRAWF